MTERASVIGGTLRGLAILMAAAAMAVVLRPVYDGHSAVDSALQIAPPGDETALASPLDARVWSLRANGWFIRVDGAEVEIPSFFQQTASRPRASLAISISPFDRLIVHHAKAQGFDWRLIAAIIFEESRFNPTSESGKGAYGLMQVRPIAAQTVGEERFHTPEDNVRTGVRYLHELDRIFAAARSEDRLRLVLAAYNMGPGHVQDAQLLARRFGYDPNRWQDAMDLMLPLLEQPAIYTQLRNGYAQGRQTMAYVDRILERYRVYQRQTAPPTAIDAAGLPAAPDG